MKDRESQPQDTREVMAVLGEGEDGLVLVRGQDGEWGVEGMKKRAIGREKTVKGLSTKGLDRKATKVHKWKPGELDFIDNRGINVDFFRDTIPEHSQVDTFMVWDVLRALRDAKPIMHKAGQEEKSAYVTRVTCEDGSANLVVITATERQSQLPIPADSNFKALALQVARTICESDLKDGRPVGYAESVKGYANDLDRGPRPETIFQALVMLMGMRKADQKFWDAMSLPGGVSVEQMQDLLRDLADKARQHGDIRDYVEQRREEFLAKVESKKGSSKLDRALDSWKLEQARQNMGAPEYSDDMLEETIKLYQRESGVRMTKEKASEVLRYLNPKR